MNESWKTINGFETYQVSDLGRIANRDTGRILRASPTRTGLLKVGLVYDGMQCTRGVALLVAEAFVDGYSDQFNTPIHRNGDQTDNRAVNLLWRQRWFAWKYFRQFSEGVPGQNKKVRDIQTNIIYKNMTEAAIANGLLVYDIWKSAYNEIPTPPTGQIFVLEK